MKQIVLLVLLFGLVISLHGPAVAESPEQRDARMAWWREARFGMFIHWGLYSVAGGEWEDRRCKDVASWLQSRLEVAPEDYARLMEGFTATNYEPQKWAGLAKAAGMKYVVVTTKHHEGFCLFDSKLTDYKVTNTPAKRDVIRELVNACRAEGLKIGFYYSLFDWHHPHYPVKGDPMHPMRNNPRYLAQQRNTDIYLDYMHGQVRELLTNYGPIDILWLDFSYGKMTGNAWRARQLMQMVRTLQPQIITNNRLGRINDKTGRTDDTYRGDFATPEQKIPPNGLPGIDWETCMTMNRTWGFKKHDHDWKSSKQLIHMLNDCASKGGNFLLNVGPKPDGTIPKPSVDRLRDMGHWMRVNSESIYGKGKGG